MACVLIINVLHMRRSTIIFTLGWLAAWGGGLGAHTPRSPDSLAASRWGTWHTSLGRLESCHPSLGTCLGLFPPTSLTQQAIPVCGLRGWNSETHSDQGASPPPLPCVVSHRQGPDLWLALPAWAHPEEGLTWGEEGRRAKLLFLLATLVRK